MYGEEPPMEKYQVNVVHETQKYSALERNMNDLSKVNIYNQHRNAFKKNTVQSLLQGD